MQTFTIQHPESGIKAVLTDIGASLLELHVPNEDGTSTDLITGPINEEDVLADNCFMGSTVGRFGNRIANGKYNYNGKDYQLTINDGKNHLHGGVGVHKKTWEVDEVTDSSVSFSIRSHSGEDGYPGNAKMFAKYEITDSNKLLITYSATTDQATPMNMVQHAYWNLTGDPSKSIEDHTVQSNDLKCHLDIDAEMIPTGKVFSSEGTVFDFSEVTPLRKGLETDDESIKKAGGYDHCLVFSETAFTELTHSLTLSDPESGRSMSIATNMPAVQVYSGNFLDGSQNGKHGKIEKRTGICIETQHYPDAVNHPQFPSPILRKGEDYKHLIEYTFH